MMQYVTFDFRSTSCLIQCDVKPRNVHTELQATSRIQHFQTVIKFSELYHINCLPNNNKAPLKVSEFKIHSVCERDISMAALKLFIVVYVTRQIFLNSVAQICFCNLLFKWRKLCPKQVITCKETIPSCNSSRTVD